MKRIELETKLRTIGTTTLLILSCFYLSGSRSILANSDRSPKSDLPKQQLSDETNQTNQTEPKRRRRVLYRRSENSTTKNTRITKSRGSMTRSQEKNSNFFQILSPTDSPTATKEGHPTFQVYFSEASEYKVIATLEENLGRTSKVFWKKEFIVDRAGLITISYPSTEKPLEPGLEYRFSIVMVLDPENRNRDAAAQVWFERLNLPPEIQQQINMANNDPIAVAAILAEHGIWYDAIDLLLASNSSTKLLSDLLSQVGLTEIAQKVTISED
ncbi:MAG: DUF928 domain-containing protein [Prochloraceae cyanobacterium]